MGKLIVLEIYGDFEHGFAVNLEIQPDSNYPATPKILKGKLPKNPDLLNQYRQWQSLYRNLETLYRPLKDKPGQVTNYSQKAEAFAACKQAADVLEKSMNIWLKSENKFRPIENELCHQLKSVKSVRIVLRTYYSWLQRLPWHLWDLPVESKPEIILSVPYSENLVRKITPPIRKDKVKILAIFGSGIASQSDRQALECLADVAEINFLEQPPIQDLNDRLWEQGWDLLFFAGHSFSQSDGQQGEIQINEAYSLTIGDLKYALKKATEKGLRLAIFNSCDGLGLAYQLAEGEAIHLPFIIVMREPVPDEVAPKFLRYFLEEYAKNGASLDAALRDARQRLHGLEKDFPCASWLPVICQSAEEVPLTWQELLNRDDNPPPTLRHRWRNLRTVFVASLVITSLLMGARWQGKLQTWELQAYDFLMQQRPIEGPDRRLLVVRITKEDIEEQPPETRGGGAASLSDAKLDALLKKLEEYQPRVIGLDIYREVPVDSRYPNLEARLRKSDRLIGVCHSSTSNSPGVSAPPEISQDRISFSDIVPDEDNVIRRHLLLMKPPSPCPQKKEMEAFSLKLALRYLKAEGIKRQDRPQDKFLNIGGVVFKRLELHTGGYHRSDLDKDENPITDMRGHQVMLNYRTYQISEEIAPSVTLKEVLNNQFHPDDVKERIVLIGVDREKDLHLTPYSNEYQPPNTMPGVFVHAQMVSQILSVVKGQRPLFWSWPWWGDIFWVWGWSLIGGILTWQLKSLLNLGIAYGIALSILYGICLVFLPQGGWIPLVPSVLALLITGTSIVVNTVLRSQKH